MTKFLSCPVCKCSETKKNIGVYIVCKNCQTLYILNPPKKEDIRKSSDKYAKINFFSTVEKKIVDIHKERLYELINSGLKGKKILDVGCGQGIFLQCVKEKKYIPYAVDISKEVVNNMKKKGIQAYSSLDVLENIKFDAITAFDVIEHTFDPDGLIKDIVSKLKQNGYIMITTPNAQGLSGRLLQKYWWVFGPDGHYTLFNVKSLKHLLKKNGFKIISIKTDIITQWLTPNNNLLKKIINKLIYITIYPLNKYLFGHLLGDNIQLIGKYKAK